MKRGEMNVKTGEYREIDFTPEEEAAAVAAAQAEANDPRRKKQQLDAALLSPATIQFLLDQVPQAAKEAGPAEVRQIDVLQAQIDVVSPMELEKP